MFAEEAWSGQPRHTEQVTTPDACVGERPATGPESDTELATRLAAEAGRLLMDLRHDLHGQATPMWDVMDHGDAASHRFIADELREHRPDDAVLDEEGAEDPRRFEADRVWIIDPLDGTREYGEGRHDWAVHVALWDRDHFVAGAVALPALDRVLATDPPPVVPAFDRERPRLVDVAHTGALRRGRSSPTRSAPSRFVSGPPAPRRWRSCSARPTSTCTTAACTSGTRRRLRRWRSPPDCT